MQANLIEEYTALRDQWIRYVIFNDILLMCTGTEKVSYSFILSAVDQVSNEYGVSKNKFIESKTLHSPTYLPPNEHQAMVPTPPNPKSHSC